MAATLSEARSILEGLDPDHVAGCLTTTKVPDLPTSLEGFRTLMAANGLDEGLVPPKRTESDDFATACRSVETKRGRKAGEQIDVREAVSNSAESVYQITRVVVDGKQRVVDHKKSMLVVLDKGLPANDRVRVEELEPEHYEALKHLEAQIRERFYAMRGMMPGSAVRTVVRELFKRMKATRWTSASSVWFVPKEHAAELEAMERVILTAYPSEAEFASVPLPNTQGVQRIVQDRAGGHAKADATKLMSEIAAKLQATGDIRADAFQRANAKATEIREYAEKMEGLLGGEVAQAREALKLVDEQLMEMWGRVK